MIKNIGKLKQWTGEKLGSAKITLQTEDFKRLQEDTERKGASYEKLHAASIVLNTQLLKRKISPEDNKSKRLPQDLYGVCLSNYGSDCAEDSALGITSIQFGQAQSKIAIYQEEFADTMKQEYMDKLDQGLQLFREYQHLRRKLESRRLDYDAKLSRLQKSKKEKPELEQEMQASKMKYEDSEYDVIQKMAALQEFEDEHCEALQQFIETQLEFFTRSVDVLNEVKSNWSQPNRNATGSIRRNNNNINNNHVLARTSSNNSGDEKPYVNRNGSVDNSTANLGIPTKRVPTRNNSSFSEREEIPMNRASPAPPPVLPRRQSQPTTPPVEIRNQRKAVYDFSGDNADELSFKVGDIIQVVEEVDEGWWIGEVIEADGYSRRGIFPVNYTEVFQQKSAGPPMPARPNLSSSTSNMSSTQIYEEPQEVAVPSPFGDSNRSLDTAKGFSYIRSNSNQPLRSNSSNTASPSQSPIPQPYKSKRAPPPPPASRAPPAVLQSRSSNTSIKTTRTGPTTPYQQPQDHYFEPATTSSCAECDCDDFSANVFKKGHCNNCFHKHF